MLLEIKKKKVFGALRDVIKKDICISRQKAIKNNEKVMKIIENVNSNRKRKRLTDADHDRITACRKIVLTKFRFLKMQGIISDLSLKIIGICKVMHNWQ